jgi:tRNA(Ile)-lysidine synthase
MSLVYLPLELRLEDKVLDFINRHSLLYPGEKVIIGVSGGADSVCLLHILHRLQDKLSIELHVAHLDHTLRGKDSAADASFVSRLARKLKISATIESADVKKYSKDRKLSTEEASRELRYQFFARVIAEQDAGCVTVAHSRNDNVETILLHLLRGTGIAGLRGLQPKSVLQIGEERLRINVVRPLLLFSRSDIEKYCLDNGLKPRTDASNVSVNYTRNRIRHELIPLLRTYNTRIDDALLRLSAIAGEEMNFLEEQTAHIWAELAEEEGSGISLDVAKLGLLPGVLQNQVLRWAIKFVSGDTRDIEAEHIEAMSRFLKKPAGKMLALPHGVRVHRGYNRLVVSLDENAPSPFPPIEEEYSLQVPGETVFPGWRVRSKITASQPPKFEQGFSAVFDLSKCRQPLTVRRYKSGDIFQPLGMKGKKSVLRFMSDSRVPGPWRSSIPLVCSGDKVIWVVGWRMDESVKIKASTSRILKLKFERAE